MNNVKIKIEVNPNAETETLGTITNKIGTSGTNSNLNNISIKANSSGVFANTPSEISNGYEILSFATENLKFTNDGFVCNYDIDDNTKGVVMSEETPKMFVWGAVPSSKEYSVKLTFSSASSLRQIVIYGNNIANQFPTEAIIDGVKTIYSDDYIWAIDLGEEAETHTIEFTKWNRPNYNACLTLIRVMLRYFELDKKWIKSIDSLSQSTGQPKEIYYGVVPNTGSSEINDINGEIKDMIIDEIIPNSNVPVQIFINGKQVQSHITIDSDYNETANSRIFSMEMKNSLSNLDVSIFSGAYFEPSSTNLYDLSKYIFSELLPYQGKGLELYTSTYFDFDDLNDAWDLVINGNTSVVETTKTSTSSIDYISGHKYYVRYDARASVDGYTSDLFFPILSGNSISGSVGTNWTTINGFVENTNGTTGSQPFRIDNNNLNTNVSMQFNQISIIDVTELGYEEKSLEWCKENLDTLSMDDYKFQTGILYGDDNKIGSVKDYLYKIKVNYSYLKEDTYKNLLNKICNLAQLQLIEDDNGKLKFLSARPKKIDNDKIISIPLKNQFSSIKRDIFIKNKYDKVEIKNIEILSKTIIEDEIQSNFNAYLLASTGPMSSEIPSSYSEFDVRIVTKGTNSFFVGIVKPNYLDKNKFIGVGVDSVNPLSPYRAKIDSSSNPIFYSYENIEEFIESIGMVTSSYGYNNEMSFSENFEFYFSLPVNTPFEDKIVSFYLSAKSFYGYYISNKLLSFGNGNNKKSISLDNEIMQIGNTYNETQLTDVISSNILNDYKNGIMIASVTVSCKNYNYTDGKIAKDISKGEIIQVGDLVRLDKDNFGTSALKYKDGKTMLWKVIGRKFEREGVEFVNLTLQEIKYINKINIVHNDNPSTLTIEYSGKNYTTDINVEDAESVKFYLSDINGFTKHIFVNGIEIQEGESFKVYKDIEITYSYSVITYTIEVNLNGGSYVSGKNIPTTYNAFNQIYFDETWFQRNDYGVSSITGTGITGSTSSVTIPMGSYGNRIYSVNWVQYL